MTSLLKFVIKLWALWNSQPNVSILFSMPINLLIATGCSWVVSALGAHICNNWQFFVTNRRLLIYQSYQGHLKNMNFIPALWDILHIYFFKGGNRFKKGSFLMIFMIFFYNKGMNIIYLYFVNILYVYLKRNCEIFKFFFWETWKISASCPSNVTIWSRYFRTFWKPQILSEINKFPNLATSHVWFLCEPNSTKKKNSKFNFLWVCKQETLIFGHFFITFLAFKKYLKQ